MENLLRVGIAQQIELMGFDVYNNEFETMMSYTDKLGGIQKPIAVAWIILKDENHTSFSTSESVNFREQGNKLFKESPEKNALDACRLYTKAILAAPPGSEALALAHANRAIALQKFGYIQQAYDDCECALEQGYPKNLRHKIIARQALCAEKLGEARLLQEHLDSLTAMSLNKTYTAQVEELQQELEKLKLKEKNSEKNEQNDKEYRGAHRITKSASKGRCLIAEKSIKKDELIFTERAHSFLPISQRHVCQNCAATQLIPFPCYNCNGRVVYCSLKCRDAHQATHAYECLGYQKDLFGNPLHHLALRMVLDEIPEIITFLSQKKTAKAIWNELTCEKSNLMQSKFQYIQTLSLITHMEKKSWPDILGYANTAIIFTSYLRNQTNFFDLFKNTKASLDDWLLVIASLILRHMGQLDVNGNTLAVLAIKIAEPFDSTLLFNKLWQSPFHVRRGLLHMFSKYEDVICANFPYYSLCNHACYPSIVTKWHGRILSTYAVNGIEAGSEILNSYFDGYLNLRRMERQSYLAHKFHFECKCVKCNKENPDQDWEKYHSFRCENCRQNFIAAIMIPTCTKCGAMQYKLMEKLEFLYKQLNTPSQKMCTAEPLLNAIKAYEDLDQWLLGPHDTKFKFSIKVVEKCFEMADIAFSTQFKQNLKRIVEILKFHLRYKIERYLLKTVDYVGPMTYLWDFIALGKYQCTAEEMQKMLEAIEILPDETRKLFINYYNDYIVGNIK